jgi:hypothetical protein
MKKLLPALVLFIAILTFSCSKDTDPTVELPISGKWLYKENIEPGCDSLVGSTFEIKGTNATIFSLPPNSSNFKVGDKIFSDIKPNPNDSNFSATGYILGASGWTKSDNVRIRIILSGSGQDMHIIYSGTDCNAKQHWIRT